MSQQCLSRTAAGDPLTHIGSFQQDSYLPSPPLPLPLGFNLPHTLNLASCHRSSFTAQDMFYNHFGLLKCLSRLPSQLADHLLTFFNMFKAKDTTTKVHHILKRRFNKLNSFQQLCNLHPKINEKFPFEGRHLLIQNVSAKFLNSSLNFLAAH